MHKFLIFSSLFFILAMVMGDVLMAQPNLPSAPNQTPIDGGMLAVAFGAGTWALKQLKRKKS